MENLFKREKKTDVISKISLEDFNIVFELYVDKAPHHRKY